jgi:hypothetical protein
MKHPIPLLIAILVAFSLSGCGWLRRNKDKSASPAGSVSEAVIATVTQIHGKPKVRIAGESGAWTEISVGYEIVSGLNLAVGFTDKLELILVSGTLLKLEQDSWILTAQAEDGTPIFEVEKGRITGAVVGAPIELKNGYGGGLRLDPKPGAILRLDFGDERQKILGLAEPLWTYGDWAISDQSMFIPALARGPNPNLPQWVIPEPGSRNLLAIGSLLALISLGWNRLRR